jgi:hypothetical protein
MHPAIRHPDYLLELGDCSFKVARYRFYWGTFFWAFSPGTAYEQAIGSPTADVPVPTNGRVIRVSITELSPSAQKFLLPQLTKFRLKSESLESIASARARNQPRENLDATAARVPCVVTPPSISIDCAEPPRLTLKAIAASFITTPLTSESLMPPKVSLHQPN